MGGAHKPASRQSRWGEAATAHQAAQPQCEPTIGIRFYKYLAPAALLLALTVMVLASVNSRIRGSIAGVETSGSFQSQMQFPANADYSKFQHSTQYHARLPCLLCHQRETTARPSLPGGNQHLPCAGCHAQQFAQSDGPMCNICHTDAKSGALKSFPRLRSFRVKFDHARHMRTGNISCATCHRASRGGVAMSIPAGFSAHTTCNRCHAPRAQAAGRDISTCGTCHELGGYRRTPQFTQAFRVGFSHQRHGSMKCNECHQVRAGMAQRRQVTNPAPLNHHATGRHQSCMTCHNGKRAFGGDDFSVCKRCHTGTTWRF